MGEEEVSIEVLGIKRLSVHFFGLIAVGLALLFFSGRWDGCGLVTSKWVAGKMVDLCTSDEFVDALRTNSRLDRDDAFECGGVSLGFYEREVARVIQEVVVEWDKNQKVVQREGELGRRIVQECGLCRDQERELNEQIAQKLDCYKVQSNGIRRLGQSDGEDSVELVGNISDDSSLLESEFGSVELLDGIRVSYVYQVLRRIDADCPDVLFFEELRSRWKDEEDRVGLLRRSAGEFGPEYLGYLENLVRLLYSKIDIYKGLLGLLIGSHEALHTHCMVWHRCGRECRESDV